MSGTEATRSDRAQSSRTSMSRGRHHALPSNRHSSTARGASAATAAGSMTSSSGHSHGRCEGAYFEWVESRSIRSPAASIAATVRLRVGWSACTTTSTSWSANSS